MRVSELFSVAFAGLVVSLAACSSSSGGATAGSCKSNGNTCVNDTDCCTGNCQLNGDVASCEDKSQEANAVCSTEGGPCTENRHCCSGLCENDACVGTDTGGPACSDVGDVCTNSDECCDFYCLAVNSTTSVCAPPPDTSGGDGGACGNEGATCTSGGDCCSGFCLTYNNDDVCSGGVSSGGGGGGTTNCGASGATCRTGNDCCSSQCESAASGALVCR